MTIRAIRIHAYGGPEVLQIDEIPTPVPSSGEAVVRVAAASVNFIDIQKRRGELVGQAFYNRWESGILPALMGSQGVGIVEEIGPDVPNVRNPETASAFGEVPMPPIF